MKTLTWKQQYLRDYRLKNKAKVKEAQVKWRKENPERSALLQKRYRTKNKKERRHHELQKLYGIIRAEPPNCEACGTPKHPKRSLCADHDHATGKFRGWLCLHCNAALGYAKDSRDRLQLLINYLDHTDLLQ